MLLRILVYSLLMFNLSLESSFPIPQCVTGYMTDIQPWVSYNGRLTHFSNGSNSIDVSFQLNCVRELQLALNKSPCSSNSSIRYVSMARCQLKQIPMVFTFTNSCEEPLSDTLQYLSLYGNIFGEEELNSAQYRVQMNASNAALIFERTSKLGPGEPAPDLCPLCSRGAQPTDSGSAASRNIQNLTSKTNWVSGLRGIKFLHLRELDLRLCGIQEFEENVFSGMPNLEKLYLGENNIFFVGASTFTGLSKLIHLDISRNYEYDRNGTYKGLYFVNWQVFGGLHSLRSLDFSFTKMALHNISGFHNISRNLERLSICHCGLSDLAKGYFSGTALKYLDVSGNVYILGNSAALKGIEKTLKVLYADDIQLSSLDMFQDLTALEILKVSNNEISTIDRKFAKKHIRLQVLILDVNRIIAWFQPTISLMSQLKFLSIRNNNINVISDEMVKDLQNVSYIGISGNFIVCNCNNRDIFELAMRNQYDREHEFVTPLYTNENNETALSFHRGFIDVNYAIATRKTIKPSCDNTTCLEIPLDITGKYLFFDYDETTYHCLQVTEGKSKSFANVSSCHFNREVDIDEMMRSTWNKLYLMILPLVMIPLLILGYIFRRNFRYFYITMRNSMMLSLINKEEVIDENTIFHYDVFVSYCNDDRAWVLDYLLPHVEKDCNVSVCLHERDFMVGLSILENIVSCMDRSKAIMLIISKQFLLSQWCQFEMHLAQHRLLETRREDLIIVLLEEIPRRLRPNTLHYLMVTNTYIVWPKEESEQNVFWRRLKKSLVTNKLKQVENDSLA